MPMVRCQLRDYQPGNPWGITDGRRDVRFSLREILHAAATVGHPDWITVLGGGSVPAIAELVWKTSICMMTLQADAVPQWYRPFYRVTDRFLGLDPSEKRGATYQLGLTLTKAYARRYLGVRWLMHLDVYWNRLTPVLQPGRSRPDLLGVDAHGNWVVFESKGRVSKPNTRARTKAKDQAGRVISVGGVAPALRASVFSYFRTIRNMGRGCLHLLSEDPPSEERPPSGRDKPEPLELPITTTELIKEYYRPLLPIMERAETTRQSEFFPFGENLLSYRVEDADLTFVFPRKLVDLLRHEQYDEVLRAFRPRRPATLVSDGIRLLPGASWEKMLQLRK